MANPRSANVSGNRAIYKGESIDYVKRIVFDKKSYIYDYLNPMAVQARVQEHLEGKMNRRLFIWSLINLEWWFRNYLPK